MRAIPTTLILSVLLAPAASAQDWIRQSPYPADVDLHAVCFLTPERGFISGADDLLMETSDGGTTWTQTTSVARDPQFSEDPIWDIQFVDDQHGFAVGNTIFRTSDGGATWQDLGSQGTVYGVDFITPDVGWVVSNLFILRTTNAGASWSMVWHWETFDPISGADFIDGDTGYVVGARDDAPGVYRTTDAGANWTRISDETFGRILVLEDDVMLATRGATFHRSTDGGVTWTQVFADEGPLVNDVEELRRIDDDSVAAIDINARIWISDDAGLTWTRTFGPLGNWGYEWDIRFADASTGYAVGRLGLVFKSIDGGHSWSQISNGAAAQFHDIEMLDTGVGIAVGDRGTIVRTEDFGRRWTILPQQHFIGAVASDFEAVEAIDDSTFVAVGDAFFRSDDAGRTWARGDALPGPGNDVSFISRDEGWIFGSLDPPWGYIARTIDGGATWTPGELMPPAQGGQVFPSGRGWGLFPQTDQVITDDGFETFTPRALPSGDSWQEFEFATEEIGWYGGFFGGVLRSDTGGYIFEAQDLPGFRHGSGAATDRLTDVDALSADEAYISILKQGAIYEGVVYRTVDGGAHWEPMEAFRADDNQTGAAITEMDVLAADRIWALGGHGFIWAASAPVPPVPGDATGDGTVDVNDLLLVLGAWGDCGDCVACPADVNDDCTVDVRDLLEVLAHWS